jgi:hypothetical protein
MRIEESAFLKKLDILLCECFVGEVLRTPGVLACM